MDGTIDFPFRPALSEHKTGKIDSESDQSNTTDPSSPNTPSSTISFTQVIVVSEDRTRIWSPSNQRMVRMPKDVNGQRRAFLEVFEYFTQVLYCLNMEADLRAAVFGFIPVKFWRSLFSEAETVAIIKERLNTFNTVITTRLTDLLETWKSLPIFPHIPSTYPDVLFAKSAPQCLLRTHYFRNLLCTQTDESDLWLKTIWEDFIDEEGFGLVLDPTKAHRGNMAAKLAVLCEEVFVKVIVAEVEEMLRIDAWEAKKAAQLREILETFRQAGVDVSDDEDEDEVSDEDVDME